MEEQSPRIPDKKGRFSKIVDRDHANTREIVFPAIDLRIYPVELVREERAVRVREEDVDGIVQQSNNNRAMMIEILNSFDPDMFVSHRTGKNKKGYSLVELRNIAKSLGIMSSSKRKGDIVKEIQNVKRDLGV